MTDSNVARTITHSRFKKVMGSADVKDSALLSDIFVFCLMLGPPGNRFWGWGVGRPSEKVGGEAPNYLGGSPDPPEPPGRPKIGDLRPAPKYKKIEKSR